jgi:hypothetical protein
MHDPSGVRVTGPLMPYADGFRAELARRGYAPGSAEFQLQLVAHLSRWLASKDLRAGELTRERALQFLEARRSSGYTTLRSERGLSPLLDHLRRLGVVSEPASPVVSTPLERLLEDYRGYLVRERGLGAGTVNAYQAVAHRFLSERSSVVGLGLGTLATADVTRFVLRECRRGYGVSFAKNLVTALRSLLRYLHVEGLTPMQFGARGADRCRLAWECVASGPPAAATTRSSCSWCVWGCAPVRWPSCSSKTSTGGRAR